MFVDSHMHTPLCKHAYGERDDHALTFLQECGFSHVSHYSCHKRSETSIASLLHPKPAG